MLSRRYRLAIKPEMENFSKYDELKRNIRKKWTQEQKAFWSPENPNGFIFFNNADEMRGPFYVSKHIREAAKAAIDDMGWVSTFTERGGLLEVREAIARKEREKGIIADLNTETCVTPGTSTAFYCAFSCLLEPGNKVLVGNPAYTGYRSQIIIFGAEQIRYPWLEGEDAQFIFDINALEKAASAGIKILILTNPDNPTGYVFTKDDLEAIAEIAEKNDLFVIADELYEKLCYNGRKFISFGTLPGMKERTLILRGVSNAESMQGYRLGYIIGPEWIINGIKVMVSITCLRVSYYMQKALLAHLNEPPKFDIERMKNYEKCSDFLVRELNRIDGIH